MTKHGWAQALGRYLIGHRFDPSQMQGVQSRAVCTARYDRTAATFDVEYQNGLIYRAEGVSRDDADRVLQGDDFDGLFERLILSQHRLVKIGRVGPKLAGT